MSVYEELRRLTRVALVLGTTCVMAAAVVPVGRVDGQNQIGEQAISFRVGSLTLSGSYSC